MKTLLCTLIACLVSLSPDRPRPDPNKEDVKALQGTWHVRLVEQSGVDQTDAIKDWKLIFEGDKFRVEFQGQMLNEGVVTRRDAGKTPKEFDFEFTDGASKGQKMIGIYKVTESTYTCCFVPAGEERPKEFKSLPGTDIVLNVLKRE
jgi:uncharacterized protein (TIGR03067 family)